ncbi:SDR family oxidoreductase [Paenibacillus sp. SYP-B3998]|uniref:SDR family oxidoreductase n=1 Tax=Paenibacillus sp. SYP-B3998 TaxID=2678564 RepID=A0A6G4A2A9_9BACL|nr:SDR family oxidoreductase [Paenibacillus sp. SYP-B3998]
MNEFDLKERVVVITGAGGRLGSEFSHVVQKHGGKAAMLDLSYSSSRLISDSELHLSVDITQPEQMKEAAEEIRKRWGVSYGLVNNACIQPKGFCDTVEDYDLATWRKVMSVNLDGLFLCSQVFGREMAENGGGSIINISSIYGMNGANFSLYKGLPFNTPPSYAASKAAVLGLTRYLACYWGDRNIRVNAVTPGGVEDGQPDVFIARYSEHTPVKRMARKDEMNGAVLYLLSDASSYVNGHNLVVDGGFGAW